MGIPQGPALAGYNMDATIWAWVVCQIQQGYIFKQHMMDQATGSSSLLKIIKCNFSGKCDRNTYSWWIKLDWSAH